MEAEKRENLIKKLQDVVEKLIKERPSAYNRCVDLTEELFYKYDKIVLVMNRRDYVELANIWHQHVSNAFEDIGIKKGFQTPHGEVDYLIVDDSVKEMYGYILYKCEE